MLRYGTTLQGVIVTALSYYMQMWTIAKRGPVFLAMSMPLTMIFTIIISSFILGDAVSLGRYDHNHF
jgi:drug/metabolite transporter (DMT)-like permease